MAGTSPGHLRFEAEQDAIVDEVKRRCATWVGQMRRGDHSERRLTSILIGLGHCILDHIETTGSDISEQWAAILGHYIQDNYDEEEADQVDVGQGTDEGTPKSGEEPREAEPALHADGSPDQPSRQCEAWNMARDPSGLPTDPARQGSDNDSNRKE